jgi:hypothetical protein
MRMPQLTSLLRIRHNTYLEFLQILGKIFGQMPDWKSLVHFDEHIISIQKTEYGATPPRISWAATYFSSVMLSKRSKAEPEKHTIIYFTHKTACIEKFLITSQRLHPGFGADPT